MPGIEAEHDKEVSLKSIPRNMREVSLVRRALYLKIGVIIPGVRIWAEDSGAASEKRLIQYHEPGF